MFCLVATHAATVLPVIGDNFDARFCAPIGGGVFVVGGRDVYELAMETALFRGGDSLSYCRSYPPIFGECAVAEQLELAFSVAA